MEQFLILSISEGTTDFSLVKVREAKTQEEAKAIFDEVAGSRDETTTVRCFDLLTSKNLRVARQRVSRCSFEKRLSVGGFTACFPVTEISTLQGDEGYKREIPFEQIAQGFWDDYFRKGFDVLTKITLVIQDGEMLIHGEGLLKAGGYVEFDEFTREMSQALDGKEELKTVVTLRDRVFDLLITRQILTLREFADAILNASGYKTCKNDEPEAADRGEEKDAGQTAGKAVKVKIPLFMRIVCNDQTFILNAPAVFKALHD
ncbi:MAG: hypothetical protein AB1465_01850 [Patescibacteria group bacterium]